MTDRWCDASERPQDLGARPVKKHYAFNRAWRTRWVAEHATRVPAGSRLLVVGAGSSPYRQFFTYCVPGTNDLAGLRPEKLSGVRDYVPLDYISDIKAIPVEDKTFDVVLCTEVLEHVPEPVVAEKELNRILKPGGRLFLAAPLGSGLHQELYHFYGGHTPCWYEKSLTEAGIEQLSIEPNGGFFGHFAQESIRCVILTAPWPGWIQLLWLTLWILSLAWGFVWITLWAKPIDDAVDKDRAFTVGFHVSAVRRL